MFLPLSFRYPFCLVASMHTSVYCAVSSYFHSLCIPLLHVANSGRWCGKHYGSMGIDLHMNIKCYGVYKYCLIIACVSDVWDASARAMLMSDIIHKCLLVDLKRQKRFRFASPTPKRNLRIALDCKKWCRFLVRFGVWGTFWDPAWTKGAWDRWPQASVATHSHDSKVLKIP